MPAGSRAGYLETTGRERLRSLVDLVDAVGRPWRKRPGALVAETAPREGWYRGYGP
jgi:hypothetical protein